MAGTQTIKVTLQRDSLQTPWGFRLQGGADFRSPFTINKITAGSPADGVLHRGDVILEIDNRPISSMLHTQALELVQRAGGQVTFLIQRGPYLSPLTLFSNHQRPVSAMAWSFPSTTSYLDRTLHPPWSPSAAPVSPTSLYRSRPLERISNPKPILSQTGSPIMPGPVPSVSTKTRGYIQPPDFHTEPNHYLNASPDFGSFGNDRFVYPPVNASNRSRTSSNTVHQNSTTSNSPYNLNNQSNIYVPSYQKKVQANPSTHKPQQQNHYITVNRPASTQPLNLVHRQFNSPMNLYSNDNVQEVMKNHVSHISRISSRNPSTGLVSEF